MAVAYKGSKERESARERERERERERGLLHAVNNPCLVTKGTWQKSDSL
jgi:hypothetical protein